jgi:hypothetical protein
VRACHLVVEEVRERVEGRAPEGCHREQPVAGEHLHLRLRRRALEVWRRLHRLHGVDVRRRATCDLDEVYDVGIERHEHDHIVALWPFLRAVGLRGKRGRGVPDPPDRSALQADVLVSCGSQAH